MDKYEFSQEDYLMYEFYFVSEKENKFVGKFTGRKNQKHDKTYKEVLKDKSEMSNFLKQFIGLEVNAKELQIYNSEFINKKYEKRISDIIYKQKDREIYFLIEHQSKIDRNMPYRILEYCMELMRDVKKNQNLKETTNPLIVPIVIYSGNRKWTVSEKFSDTQKVEKKYKKYSINLKYKLIDVNKYSKEELTNKNTKMTSIMLLEKCTSQQEARNVLIQLLKKADKLRREWLENLIKYAYTEILEDKEILRLINREEKLPMEDWIQRMKEVERKRQRSLEKRAIERGLKKGMQQGIERGIERGIEQGIEQGMQQGMQQGIEQGIETVIKNMLKENQDEETIIKYTNAKKENIEKIKRELAES